MIVILLNERDFEYDLHSLVKAFYPGDEVKVFLENEDPGEWERKISIFYGSVVKATITEADGTESEREEETVPEEVANDRKQRKSLVKRLVYRLLNRYTKTDLPWGTLTGIRPTKIAMSLLESGMKNTEIASYMKDFYYSGSKKTALAIAIANREHDLLSRIPYQNGYSLYVGIPFCPSICLYCSFSSSPIGVWKKRVEEYLDALFYEIDQCKDIYAGKILNTVYVGGGTPTTLEADQLDRLLTKLEESFDYSNLSELTVEAGRPDSITEEKLRVLKKHGVGRISINPQTMNQVTLDIIGRKHTVEQTIEMYQLARTVGFDNINMDLIVGLPGEGMEEVRHTLEEIGKLSPESLTVHSLSLKRGARLALFKDQYQEMSFVNNQEIMSLTEMEAMKMGMGPYYLYRQKNMAGNMENTGYSIPGCEGIYNILMMEEKQSILALGAGASTKLVLDHNEIKRFENVKDIRNYLARIDEMVARKKQGIFDAIAQK